MHLLKSHQQRISYTAANFKHSATGDAFSFLIIIKVPTCRVTDMQTCQVMDDMLSMCRFGETC